MSSDWTEVRGLVATLAEKILNSETELDSQALGNALYGLQSMNSIHAEVSNLKSFLNFIMKMRLKC